MGKFRRSRRSVRQSVFRARYYILKARELARLPQRVAFYRAKNRNERKRSSDKIK